MLMIQKEIYIYYYNYVFNYYNKLSSMATISHLTTYLPMLTFYFSKLYICLFSSPIKNHKLLQKYIYKVKKV